MSAPETDRATRKRQQQRWLAAVNVVLFLGLAFQLNYLSYRHYERWDWTEHDLYTLSDRSKAVLEQLDQPVQLFILMSEQDPAFRDLQNLLERYRTETDQLDVQYVDPERDPGRYREVSQRFATGEVGALGLPTDVVAVIAVGERHRTIERNDLVHQSFDPMGDEDTIELDVQSERSLTGAIVDLTQAEPTTLCVSTGHGELALEGGERSLSGFADQIRGDSVELEQLETRGQSRVPARCDALAIIGPQIAFPEAAFHVCRTEWDFWRSEAALTGLPEERQSFVVGARSRFDAIEERTTLFDAGSEPVAGVEAMAAFGHTPGHCAFVLHGLDAPAMVVGDAISNDPVSFARPDLPWGADQDPEMGAATRRRLLDRLAADRLRFVGFHLPQGGLGRVEADGNAYRFVPEA